MQLSGGLFQMSSGSDIILHLTNSASLSETKWKVLNVPHTKLN
jgi:hypothetical protein